MNVGELRRQLADLPAEVPVLLNGRVQDQGGFLSNRFDTIERVILDPDDRDRVFLRLEPFG